MTKAFRPHGLRPVLWMLLIVPLLLAGAAGGQDKPAPGPGAPQVMSLDDCIVQAVKGNLGVAVQVQTFRQADAGVLQAGEKFIPSLTFDLYKDSRNSASYSWIDSNDIVSSLASSTTAGVSQNVPFGGQLSVSMGTGQNESNTRFQTINPRYGGSLSFSFSQPLLKDFGWTTSRKEILVARNNRDIAENDLRASLLADRLPGRAELIGSSSTASSRSRSSASP